MVPLFVVLNEVFYCLIPVWKANVVDSAVGKTSQFHIHEPHLVSDKIINTCYVIVSILKVMYINSVHCNAQNVNNLRKPAIAK